MSEILIGTNPNKPQIVGSINFEATEAEKAKQLPTPAGYRILCAIPETEDTYESGIAKSDLTIKNDEVLTTVLFVVSLGSDCYKDKERFPNGPYCKEGDFILVRPNAGTRLVIHGREFRIINDDSVEAVVQDPRGITRKFI
jgi:co-chaperonin GroES (HSP10)|tara:strand:+ start:32 stop:454 length:423 start_codon:yes stop_codon:yes gene_type:complete